MVSQNIKVILYLLMLVKIIKASTNKYGVLAAESASHGENFCIIYFEEFLNLPEEKSKAELHHIVDASSVDWCTDQAFDSQSKILLLIRNNCSITQQASNVQDKGGKGILFITSRDETSVPINESLAKHINISVGLISQNSVKILHEMGNMTLMEVSGRMFSPANLNFDYSLLVIWIISIFSVAVGSFWSGLVRLEIYSNEISQLPAVSDGPAMETQVKTQSNTVELSSINVSPASIGFFVLCMGGMLLVLYFLFDYFVYIIIGLFVLATAISLHGCLEPLVLKIPAKNCVCLQVHFFRDSFICDLDFRQICLMAFSAALSLTWFFLRKEKYSWILQDFLGVAFCVHMLKSIRLPSLKICTLLLVLLFFYDIFFVFITPFFTHKGESVMEEVATGGSSDESLPMVLKVIHFKFNALGVCYEQYSILGFGDILVPGLLISYCHGFDLIANKKRLYFPITVATYGIGLLITFVALFLMNTAQPALLYLVPATLLPPLLLGWCRGELSLLWKGFKVIKTVKNSEAQTSTNTSAVEATSDDPASGQRTNVPIMTESTNEVTGEKKHLLQ